MSSDIQKRFEKNLGHKINRENLSIVKTIEGNGRISVILASDSRYYIYHEIARKFEYPSHREEEVLKMYYSLIQE